MLYDLQVEVYAHTEYSVGTCEVVGTFSLNGLTCHADLLVVFLVEVAVVGPEVCYVDTYFLGNLYLRTKAE